MKYPQCKRGWVSHNATLKGVQARFGINGRECSKCFSYSRYHSPADTEQAAQQWLDGMRAQHSNSSAVNLRTRPSPRKTSALPVGICESRCMNRSGSISLRLQVLWHDGTKPRVKVFTVGLLHTVTEADYRAAKKRAITFRRAYEHQRGEATCLTSPS